MADLVSALSIEGLRALDDRRFAVIGPGTARFELTLESVTELGRRPAGSRGPDGAPVREECFSLLFVGPNDPPLPQGTWRFEHAELGAGDLFVVPVLVGAAMRYEVIFF